MSALTSRPDTSESPDLPIAIEPGEARQYEEILTEIILEYLAGEGAETTPAYRQQVLACWQSIRRLLRKEAVLFN